MPNVSGPRLKRRRGFAIAFIAAAVAMVAAFPKWAHADVSFAGERIVWIVPSSAGGGTDNFTRFLLPHLQRNLPGNPTIVVQNLPGAGTVPGHNNFWHNAKDDGLTLLTMTIGGQTAYIFGEDVVQYDPRKFIPILSVPQGVFHYAQPNLGMEGPGDLASLVNSGKAYSLSGQTPTSASASAYLTYYLLGIKTTPIWGLSSAKSRQAFLRGELDFNVDTASSWLKVVKAKLIPEGKAVPLLTFGLESEDGTMMRDPLAPDVPHFLEQYEELHGKKLTGEPLNAWLTLFNIVIMNSKSVMLHPSTKPEIVEAYHKAVQDMLKDPVFIEAKSKGLGDYPVTTGKRAKQVLLAALDLDPKVCAWMANWLEQEYDSTIKCSE